jgi:acetyl-CoA C-acetyltransferase
MNIIGAKRTHIGSLQGSLKDSSAVELGASVLKAVRGELNVDLVDEVIMGCVVSSGLGQAPARQASLKAGNSISTPAMTINKVCGSGMAAIIMAADRIKLKESHIVLAGGMESMTNVPYILDKARSGYRYGHATMYDGLAYDALEDATLGHISMGYLAETLATEQGFSRIDQDNYALASLERAKSANFEQEIVGDGKDDILLKAKPEKIPSLKPAFGGTITAASASGIGDGAAALLLASDEAVIAHGLITRATILGHAQFSREPTYFTKAPVGAIQKLLEKLHWTVDDVDLFEVNEAFAVVPMYAMKVLNIPHSKMNVNGGACAIGHPLGASGARVVVTLLHALEQRNMSTGIAAICIGGGEGIAIAIRREKTGK